MPDASESGEPADSTEPMVDVSKDSSSDSSSSSASSTPSANLVLAAFDSSNGSTPSSAVSFPASFSLTASNTQGRSLIGAFEAAVTVVQPSLKAAVPPTVAPATNGETVPAGGGTRSQAREEQLAKDALAALAKLSMEAKEAADIFRIDCTDFKSAIRSTLVMERRIVSMLLPEHSPDPDQFETVNPDHPGRVRYDPYGSKIPVYWRTLPHLIFVEAKTPVRPEFDDNLPTVLLPYWVFPTAPDNSCVPASLYLSATSPELHEIKRKCSTFQAVDVKTEFNKICDFRKKCGEWMEAAKKAGLAHFESGAKGEPPSDFAKLCSGFGVAYPKVDLKDPKKTAAATKEWNETFSRHRALIAGKDPATLSDFAALVAFMTGSYVQTCTYRSINDADVSPFRLDCDFPQGLVSSQSPGLVLLPQVDLPSEDREPPYFVDSKSTAPIISVLSYYRHGHEKKERPEKAPAQTAAEYEKSLKDWARVSGVGHCEPMFAAPNFMTATASHPFFRCEIARMSPMIPMPICRFFSVEYLVQRTSPVSAAVQEFQLARIGSVLKMEVSVDSDSDSGEGQALMTEEQWWAVAWTFIKLSSQPWSAAMDGMAAVVAAGNADGADEETKAAGVKAAASLKKLEQIKGLEQQLAPVGFVVLVRINPLKEDAKRKDLQAELDRVGAEAAEGRLEIKIDSILNIIQEKGEFFEVENYKTPTRKPRGTVTLPAAAQAQVQTFVDDADAGVTCDLGKTIATEELVWPDSITNFVVDFLWDNYLKEEVDGCKPAAAVVKEGEEKKDPEFKVQDLQVQFLEEVDRNSIKRFDDRPLRIIRSVFADRCPWEDAFIQTGAVKPKEAKQPLIDLSEDEEKKPKKKNSDGSPVVDFEAPGSTLGVVMSESARVEWENACEAFMLKNGYEPWPKKEMTTRFKNIATGFFKPTSIWAKLRPLYDKLHPAVEGKKNSVSTAGAFLSKYLLCFDPQAWLFAHLHAVDEGKLTAEALNDPDQEWRKAAFLKTVPVPDPPFLNFATSSKKNSKNKNAEEEEEKEAKKNKNGDKRQSTHINNDDDDDSDDDDDYSGSESSRTSDSSTERRIAAALKTQELEMQKLKKELEQEKARSKAAAAELETRKRKEREGERSASRSASVGRGRKPPTPRTALPSGRKPPTPRPPPLVSVPTPSHSPPPPRFDSPPPSKKSKSEEKDQIEKFEEEVYKRIEARLTETIRLANSAHAAPSSSTPAAVASTPAAAALTPAAASSSTPAAAALTPTAASSSTTPLTESQVLMAKTFAELGSNADRAKFLEMCQWLQSGSPASSTPASASSSIPPPAAASSSPPLQIASTASTGLVPMDEVLRAVHALGQSRSTPTRQGHDQLQLWQQPSQVSSFVPHYPSQRQLGMQDMASTINLHAAIFMAGANARQ
jgi:hypothetical protein